MFKAIKTNSDGDQAKLEASTVGLILSHFGIDVETATNWTLRSGQRRAAFLGHDQRVDFVNLSGNLDLDPQAIEFIEANAHFRNIRIQRERVYVRGRRAHVVSNSEDQSPEHETAIDVMSPTPIVR